MPGVSALQVTSAGDGYDDDTVASDAQPETERLWLPSDLSEEFLRSCSVNLLDKEIRLRKAQADDALHHVQRQVRIWMGLIHYKQVQVDGPGQQSNTRARNLISRLSGKLDCYASRYDRTPKIVIAAHPDDAWKMKYLPLNKEDI